MDQQAFLLNSLQQQVSELQDRFNALQQRPAPVPKPKLPDPDKFDGSQQMWEVWEPEITAKLRIDAAVYDSAEAKFFYVYGRLEQKTQALVAPQLAAAERHGYDHTTILTQLSRLCDNPNAKREAQNKLAKTKQYADQTFNNFLARFERQLYRAEAELWSDDAKIALIRQKLNAKLTERLNSQMLVPETYENFVKFVQRLEDGISARPATQMPWEKKDATSPDSMEIGALGVKQITWEEAASSEDETPVGRALLSRAQIARCTDRRMWGHIT